MKHPLSIIVYESLVRCRIPKVINLTPSQTGLISNIKFISEHHAHSEIYDIFIKYFRPFNPWTSHLLCTCRLKVLRGPPNFPISVNFYVTKHWTTNLLNKIALPCVNCLNREIFSISLRLRHQGFQNRCNLNYYLLRQVSSVCRLHETSFTYILFK